MRMPWTVAPRTERAPLASLVAPLAAVSATVLVGLLLFMVTFLLNLVANRFVRRVRQAY